MCANHNIPKMSRADIITFIIIMSKLTFPLTLYTTPLTSSTGNESENNSSPTGRKKDITDVESITLQIKVCVKSCISTQNVPISNYNTPDKLQRRNSVILGDLLVNGAEM